MATAGNQNPPAIAPEDSHNSAALNPSFRAALTPNGSAVAAAGALIGLSGAENNSGQAADNSRPATPTAHPAERNVEFFIGLPDDVCKAKVHYLTENRSLKVLVAMSRGLRDDEGRLPIFDESVEPWRGLKEQEWDSTRPELAKEISRRWKDYKPGEPDNCPRPNGWNKPRQVAWLMDNSISYLGDENTTSDADCQFIRVALAQVRLVKIASAAEVAG